MAGMPGFIRRLLHTPDRKHIVFVRLAAGIPLVYFAIVKVARPEVQESFRAAIDASAYPFPEVTIWLAVIVEMAAGLLLIPGAVARLGGLLGVVQALAALLVHLTADFSAGAPTTGPPPWLPLIVGVCSAYVVVRGAGAWSLDHELLAGEPGGIRGAPETGAWRDRMVDEEEREEASRGGA